MRETFLYGLQILSAFSVVLPLVASFRFHPKTDAVKIFTIFLMAGFAFDLAGWYLVLTKSTSKTNIYIRDLYYLIEPIILFLFIAKVSSNKVVQYIFSRLWLLVIIIWPLTLIYREAALAPYRSSFQLVMSFVSCYCILKLIEKEPKFSLNPMFWTLLGLFFYFFCTFILKLKVILMSELGQKIWFLHHIVNILTNLIFFYGFLRPKPIR